MRRIFTSCLVIVLLSAMLAGCTEPKVYRIGISQCSSDDWRNKMNEEILREMMFHEDAEVEIRSADDSSQRQIDDIRYFADNGFDIIIVAPNEAEALTPAIRDVYERGIPVIIFDRSINGDTYTARICADDEAIGRSAARYAFNILGPKPKAIEIYGLPGSTPAEGRHDGFAREFAANGGELVASVPGNWNQHDAMHAADSLLRVHSDVDLVYAHNDRMAIGASEVARKLGLRGIKVIGIDAAPEIGIKAVADSLIDATFLYPTEGHRIIRTALAILKGEPFDREVRLPSASAVDISNADILLLQNEALKEETGKMQVLKDRIDAYWASHSSQTSLFYASIAIIVLLFGVFFLLLRAYWQRRRHQEELMERNKLLEEQRDMQKQLNERLQEATQSKLMFFTNVSHDLRTPLTLIAEPVEQLCGAPNLTAQQHTLMQLASRNVRILHRLINQILDFRKFENGMLTANLVEMDFSAALAEWVESFRSVARKRDIKLGLKGPDGDHLIAAFDPEKMERVVFNLLSNAFKYTPDNGSVTVEYAVSGDRLTLSVTDTGRGISERDMGNIFDRFYQVDRVHPNGSGIGLSLVKAFVELHGGEVAVKSELDRGTVFTVTLPLRHVESQGPVVSETNIRAEDVETELGCGGDAPAFDSDKPLALVIDDNKDIRSLVGQLLSDEYNVIFANDGKEGLKAAAKYVPDIVVCDVMMPVMDGLECCRRIKGEVSTSHIPVLMLTACSMDEQRVQGYESGADGYLSKPFSGAVLRARCASLVANRKRIKELSGTVSASECKPKGAPADIDNDFYARFIEIFRSEMGNPDISVDKIAGMIGLERSQFYRKIKSLTNYSPVELMRRLRLNHARTLLTTTDRSVSEIAYATGFSTPAYFTKCYRDAFGETPTDTRASIGR